MAMRGNAVFKGILLLFSVYVCVVSVLCDFTAYIDNIKIVLSGDLNSL